MMQGKAETLASRSKGGSVASNTLRTRSLVIAISQSHPLLITTEGAHGPKGLSPPSHGRAMLCRNHLTWILQQALHGHSEEL